jgi:hypothetical protein
MAWRFLQILILTITITHCWLQNPTLPLHFKIHSNFTLVERELILKAADKWNNLAKELTEYDKILIYDGIDDRQFEITMLDDGINTIYQNLNHCLNKSTSLGGVPIGGENIFICTDNIRNGYDNLYNQDFDITITHEFGHFLGIGMAHINENPNNTPEDNEQVTGVMCNEYYKATSEFSVEDKRLFCMIHKCKNNI